MKYNVRVKPGSSQEKVVEETPGELTVFLYARAHDGEANAALIAVLAKHFGVAKSRVQILRGAKSRNKLIEI